MKPAPFEYSAPESLKDALDFKAQHGDDAILLAGGQSMIPAMNFRLMQPTLLLDLNLIRELNYIRSSLNGEVMIGAMTSQRQLEQDPLITAHAPLLNQVIPHIAHPQIRNRGTIGGSIVHADPAAELPVAAVALNARFRVQTRDTERWIDAIDFFQGYFMTDIAPEEIMTDISLPSPLRNTGWSFLEVARRRGDYAMAGIAASVTVDDNHVCKDAKLVYLNLGSVPMNAQRAAKSLRGERFSSEIVEAVAAAAAEDEIDPVGTVHASIPYQRHLAQVLTRRALTQAFKRTGATT